MKKCIIYSAVAVVMCVLFSGAAPAASIYVKSLTKITMRTGPGVDHKIIAMLETGTALETIESRSDWTKVKTKQGKTGWVLTRFVTREKPGILLLDELKKENADLTREVEALKKKNADLSEKENRLAQIQEKYTQLKNKSRSLLDMEEKNAALEREVQKQKEVIETLEGKLKDENLIWFLAGAGIFIFGILLGMSARRNRRSSLL